ncbi:MAG: hypothetical protein JSS02_24175 [Planctomycetes bacterium]|nr:hypothetical protein [Planctomycetota bacterium]
MLKKLWMDESGFIVSAELVLVATILVIGMIVGLATVRDAIVTELADVGQAIANVNQSYIYTDVTGHSSATAGSIFQDALDFCDAVGVTNANNSRCVLIQPTVSPTEAVGPVPVQ